MPQGAPKAQGQSLEREEYLFQRTRLSNVIVERTAESWASYLLPLLRPGMSLLDCGCGPGSITLGLAKAVAPGSVVGIDLQPSQVDAAEALAKRERMLDVRFQVGDVYELPFPDASFDVVHTQALLMYLKDPLKALKEVRRVLKPGGMIGVHDCWWDKAGFAPTTPLLEEYERLIRQFNAYDGYLWDYPPRQRQFLFEAGFVDVQSSANVVCTDTPALHQFSLGVILALISPNGRLARTCIEQGWADEAKWEAIRNEWRAWEERPEAFFCWPWCWAIGWVPE